MKTPLLFDLPAKAGKPQKRDHHRQALKFVKAKFGILTHYAKHIPKDCERWLAVMPEKDDAGKSIVQIMAESAELYERCGLSATDTTEFKAVQKLLAKQEIVI